MIGAAVAMRETFHEHVFTEDERLHGYMLEWADYAGAPSGALSYPNHSPGLQNGGSSMGEIEEVYQKLSVLPRVKCIDAIVQGDLPAAQRAAVLHNYEIARVFQFPRNNLPYLLAEAHERIRTTLKAKGHW